MSRLEQHFMEEEQQREARMLTETKKFADLVNKLENKFSDDVSELFKNLAKDNDRQDKAFHAKHLELSKRIEAVNKEAEAGIARLEDRQRENDLKQDAETSEMYTKLESHIMKEAVDADEKLEAEHKYFGTLFSNLEKKFAEEGDTLDQKFDQKTQRLDERISERHAETQGRIDGEHKFFNESLEELEHKLMMPLNKMDVKYGEQCSKFERVIKANYTELGERFEGGIGQVRMETAKINKKQLEDHAEVDQKLTDGMGKLDKKFTEKLTELTSNVDHDIKRTADEFQRLNAKFAKKSEEADEKFGALINSMQLKSNGRMTAVEKRVEDEKKRVVEEHSSLERKLKEGHESLDERFTAFSERLTKSLTAKKAAQDARVESIYKQLSDGADATSKRLTETTEGLDNKFTAVCKGLEENFTASMAEHNERIENEVKHVTYLCNRLEKTMTEEIDELRAEQTEKDVARDARLAELDNTVANNHDTATTQLTALSERVESKTAAMDARIDAASAKMVMDCESMRDQFTEQYAFLDLKLTEKDATLDERLDEFSDEVMRQTEKFDKTCDNLEKRLSETTTRQAEELDDHHKYFFQQCMHLNTLFTDGHSGMLRKIEEHHAEILGVRDAMDRKLDEQLQETMARIRDEGRRIEAKLPDMDEKQLIYDTRKQFADRCYAIEEKLKVKTDDLDAKVVENQIKLRKEVDMQFEASEEHLHSEISKMRDSTLEQTDKLAIQITELRRQHLEQGKALERKVDNESVRLDKRTDELKTDTTERFARVEKLVSDTADTTRQSLMQKIDDMKDYLQELRMVVDSNMDETKRQFTNHGKKLNDVTTLHDDMIRDLERNLATATSRLEQRLDTEKAENEMRDEEDRKTAVERVNQAERKAADANTETERKLMDSGKKLQAMIDAASRNGDLRQDREHKFFLDQCAQLRTLLDRAEETADRKLAEARTGIDAKFTLKTDDIVRKMEDLQHYVDENGKDMDAAFAANMTRAKEETLALFADIKRSVQTQNAAQDERSTHVTAELKSQCQYLRQTLDQGMSELRAGIVDGDKGVIAKLQGMLDQTVSGLLDDVDTIKMETKAEMDSLTSQMTENTNATDESMQQLKTSISNNLSAAVITLGDTLDASTLKLTQQTAELKSKVEVDVATSIKDVDQRVTKNITELTDYVNTTVQKSINQVTTQLEVVNVRVQQEIMPAVTETKAAVVRCENNSKANKDRIVLAETTLKSDLSGAIGALDGKIEEMTQGMDLANILNSLAKDAGSA